MFKGWLRSWLPGAWPWLVLATFVGLGVWHVLDFSEIRETDFPRVVRPFHNPWPPAAYRLAEPGDTLDRVGLYLASIASALALMVLTRQLQARSSGEPVNLGLWPTALAVGLAATWHAATPGPTFDGWHGLGWRVILDPSAPTGVRISIATFGLALVGVVGWNLARARWLEQARESRVVALLGVSLVFVVIRQIDPPGIGPDGYWSRCFLDLSLLAFGLALVLARPRSDPSPKLRPWLGFAAMSGVLIVAGMAVSVYHRPLARLHAVVSGKIYISAMPSYRALAIEQDRLHFRTIINLFDEASTQGSPYHDDEIRFVREHGLRYLGSPSDGLESDHFLDETLALAQNPDAWPILVHCHGCMDRSPSWMGLYRFLIERKSLDEVFREIERHRGSRPKAVVSLQYARKLPPRASDRFATDPGCQLLQRCVAGTADPFLRPDWNPTATTRKVVTRIEPDQVIHRP
jgi:hypothetical protein